ncbi:hypothetical protein F5B20DRAFT_495517 [Whalleya microplaca]|nr:hypothetical protein F5B20DRAFT_495517 [Whalleya microplaca]
MTKFVRRRKYIRRMNDGEKIHFGPYGENIPLDKANRHLQLHSDPPPSPTGSVPTGISYQIYESPVLKHSQVELPAQESKGKGRQMPTTRSPRMAFYDGYDAEHYLDISRKACGLTDEGKYLDAKPTFIDSLEALETMLSLFHNYSL